MIVMVPGDNFNHNFSRHDAQRIASTVGTVNDWRISFRVTSLNRLRISRVRSDFGDRVSRGYGPFEAQPARPDAIAARAAIKLVRARLMWRGGFITRLQSIGYRDLR